MQGDFPEPVGPPESVAVERRQRESKILRAVWRGGTIRCSVIAAELIGYAYFGSSALLVDALASTMDVVATVVLAFCVRLAGRPPDQNHPFGHGRYEPLAGLQLGIFLALLGAWIFAQQTVLAASHPVGGIDARAWVIPFVCVLLLETSYQQAMHTARKADSPALYAEAWHYRIDALNSLLATIALVVAALLPEWGARFDHLGALAIAGLMLVIGVKATRENLRQLMDHVPNDEVLALVQKAAKKVEGVLGTEKIRIQTYGPDAHVDIDIEVDPMLSVDRAHRISQKVRAEIQRDWPSVRDVTVHIEPYYAGDH